MTTKSRAIPAPLSLCVPADLIGVPQLFVSNEAARFYMTGICLSPLAEGSGVTATATDGNVLGCMHSADGYVAREIILRIEDRSFATLCRKRGRKLNGSSLDGGAWVCALPGAISADGKNQAKTVELLLIAYRDERPDTGAVEEMARQMPSPKGDLGLLARTYAEPIDVTYPAWRRVIPPTAEREKVDQPGYVNPALVERFADAARALDTKMRITVPTDHLAPHFVDLAVADFVGLLMPMRHGKGGERYERPGWIDTPSAADAALAAEREASRDAIAEQDVEKAA